MSDPIRYSVEITADAEADLEEIHAYIEEHDSEAAADHVVGKIEEQDRALQRFPEKGSIPRELLALGIREYRQTFFKPYRLIYKVAGRKVYVYLVADGRQDFRALLMRRLLGA